jgi:predicted nucleic acid-binding protein
MRFWDSSALVPLIAAEPAREALLARLDDDPHVLAWWGATVEIASALARLEREAKLRAEEVAAGFVALRALADSWHEIVPTEAVRRTAERLLRVHPLRAADSLQLAAAIVASDHDPATLDFVCLDARLAAAAQREGFTVVGLE